MVIPMKKDALCKLSDWLDKHSSDAGKSSMMGAYRKLGSDDKDDFEHSLQLEIDRLRVALHDTWDAMGRCKDQTKLQKLLAKSNQITRDLDDLNHFAKRINPTLVPSDQPETAPKAIAQDALSEVRVATRGRGSGLAHGRDFVVRKYSRLSDPEICSKLDAELMQRDAPPIGFINNWTEKYGVKGYLEAYMKVECRNLVQKMISKAKKRG